MAGISSIKIASGLNSLSCNLLKITKFFKSHELILKSTYAYLFKKDHISGFHIIEKPSFPVRGKKKKGHPRIIESSKGEL